MSGTNHYTDFACYYRTCEAFRMYPWLTGFLNLDFNIFSAGAFSGVLEPNVNAKSSLVSYVECCPYVLFFHEYAHLS